MRTVQQIQLFASPDSLALLIPMAGTLEPSLKHNCFTENAVGGFFFFFPFFSPPALFFLLIVTEHGKQITQIVWKIYQQLLPSGKASSCPFLKAVSPRGSIVLCLIRKMQ